MSDETTTETETKHKGGWPKGKPRGRARVAPTPDAVAAAADRAMSPKPSLISRMKARPNWESDDFVGVGQDGADRLHIPKEIVDALWRDGVALQMCTRSVRGMETPQEMSKMTRGGWTPVHQEDFGGLLDGMFMSKGEEGPIVIDDCILCARPAEIQKKARAAERRDAVMPLQIAEEQLGHGIPNVTGSNHPTATRGNQIKKTMERIEIPE